MDQYCMLAFDHRGSYKKFINPENPDSVTLETGISIKKDIIEACYDHFSGVLVDLDYGLPAYKQLEKHEKPFLLPAEKSGYTNTSDNRITEIQYSAKELKDYGAIGVKLLIYFNPTKDTANKQIETTKRVLEDAHANNLPLFLEIVHYDYEKEDRVAESVQTFLDAGIRADVFKLEYPGSKKQCEKVTEILGDTPWIVLTRGVTFEVFYKQLQIAVAAGCVGFLAGRALWQEYPALTDSAEKEKFLKEILPTRFEGLNRIVQGKFE